MRGETLRSSWDFTCFLLSLIGVCKFLNNVEFLFFQMMISSIRLNILMFPSHKLEGKNRKRPVPNTHLHHSLMLTLGWMASFWLTS